MTSGLNSTAASPNGGASSAVEFRLFPERSAYGAAARRTWSGELRDLRLAVRILTIGAMLLCAGAALGLNTWPARDLVLALASGSGDAIFVAGYAYSLILVILFWGSRPTSRAVWAAVVTWPFAIALLGYGLDSVRHFSALGDGMSIFMLLSVAMAVPALVMLGGRVLSLANSGNDAAFETRLRYLVMAALLFMLVAQPALSLSTTLHPFTLDLHAWSFDRVTGLTLGRPLTGIVDAVPFLPALVRMAYGMTPAGFMAAALYQLRGKPAHVPSALLTWVVLSTAAYLAYHVFSVAGPRYAFGENWLAALVDPQVGTPEPIGLGLAPRNGMPSLHFGWLLAATILLHQSRAPRWATALMTLFMSLTAIATLYLGEHYAVDLIVAVPFVLAGIALSTTSVPLTTPSRRNAVFTGFVAWAAWMALLRSPWFVESPFACWTMVVATAGAVVYQFRCLRACERAATVAATQAKPSELAGESALSRRIAAMFFVSGAAALVYQVLFAKQLAYVFGSTATATFTVLATFLGGMALGSLLGGQLAQRIRRPLLLYALVETAIGVYCILTPKLFELVRDLYVVLASGQPPDAPILLALRVSLGGVVLLVPTVLMGATLPLLTQLLAGHLKRIGEKVAWLYFANTAGAAVGALVAGYAIIPALGAVRTTLAASVLNLVVALIAIYLSKRLGDDATEGAPAGTSAGAPSSERAAWTAMAALCAGGVLSLGLEVVYVHMLSIVAGNSVYAFGLMVATFLLGLSLGGEIARRVLLRADVDRLRSLAWSLLGLGSCVALGAWMWNGIPTYFAQFGQYPLARSFAAREAIRGLVCALLMIPPTIFIGAAYAFAMDIATASRGGRPVARLGIGAALNTLGNITGVLLFGFVLLPALGGLGSTGVIAFGALALAAFVCLVSGMRVTRRDGALLVAGTLVIGTSLGARLDYDILSTGANVYFAKQAWGSVMDHAESIDGGLTTVAVSKNPSGEIKTLLTNGKFQGNDALLGEMQAQIGFAIAPLLHQERRERALVIGYGTGVTSRVLHEAGFKQVDIAELSRDVVNLADRHLREANDGVSTASGVHLNVTDGRNLLLLAPQEVRYDVISIEVSSIWFAGAASLYNREFYALARSRMAPDAVLQQWVQLHHLAPTDVLSIIASLRAEFRYVSLYIIGSQGILVATQDEGRRNPSLEALRALEGAPSLAAVRGILQRSLSAITEDRLLDDRGIDRYIKETGLDGSLWWSTDNNLSLEYSTPRGNVNDTLKSQRLNLEILARFR